MKENKKGTGNAFMTICSAEKKLQSSDWMKIARYDYWAAFPEQTIWGFPSSRECSYYDKYIILELKLQIPIVLKYISSFVFSMSWMPRAEEMPWNTVLCQFLWLYCVTRFPSSLSTQSALCMAHNCSDRSPCWAGIFVLWYHWRVQCEMPRRFCHCQRHKQTWYCTICHWSVLQHEPSAKVTEICLEPYHGGIFLRWWTWKRGVPFEVSGRLLHDSRWVSLGE